VEQGHKKNYLTEIIDFFKKVLDLFWRFVLGLEHQQSGNEDGRQMLSEGPTLKGALRVG
jgi:hypothetical protein